MCRLLGLVANKLVDIEFSLLKADKPFRKFGDKNKNPDGWGIGWYEGNNAEVFKEGISAKESNQFLQKSKEVISKIIIAHVRKGTGAEPSERNSHPFKHKNWLFAHNGSVDRENLLTHLNEKYRTELEGETDSEVYFRWLLQCIDEAQDTVKGIKRAIEYVRRYSHSGLNFLLSDGSSLYAFRYSSYLETYYSLYRLKRDPSETGPLEFKSKETKALLHSKSLKGEKAILVCSEKLTEEDWKEIALGNMLVIEPDLNIREVKIL